MYRMLKKLVEVKDFVDEEVYVIDWDWIISTLNCLEDVAILTTKMQKEVYFMGDFFKDLEICKYDLEQRMDHSSGTAEAEAGNGFIIEMLDLLKKRTTPLFNTPTFAAAIICDPRLNTADGYAIDSVQRETGMVRTLIFLLTL